MLKAANPGYRTAHYGKWDHRSGVFPEQLGYDESDGNTGNKHGVVSSDKDSKWTEHYLNNDPKRIETLTARAINFVQRNRAAGSPFYLQLSHYATHVDMQAKEETYAKYVAKPKGRVHAHPAWAAMMEDLDTGIGRLLDEVDRLGLADNTYIIPMADNGAAEFIPPVKNKLAHPSEYPVPPRNTPLRGGKWDALRGRDPRALHRARSGYQAGFAMPCAGCGLGPATDPGGPRRLPQAAPGRSRRREFPRVAHAG